MKEPFYTFVPIMLVWVLLLSACVDGTGLAGDEQDQSLQATPTGDISMPGDNVSSGSGPPGGEAGGDTEIKWVNYKNTEQGFSLRFPEGYVFRENASDLSKMQPSPIYEIEFFDSEEAVGIQPATLSIRVYQLPQDSDLAKWLEDSGILQRYGSSRDIAAYTLRNMQAFKVTSQQLIAPNWGVYAAHPVRDVVYELIPLGTVGERMLQSFSVVEFR